MVYPTASQHSFRWHLKDLKVKKWKIFFHLWCLIKPEASFCISSPGSDADKCRDALESTTQLYSCLVSLFVLLFHPFLILALLWKYFTLFFILGIDSMVFSLMEGILLCSRLAYKKGFLLFPGYSFICVPLLS